jgi:phage terminase Nu1 subunit (DNA packaging protein)
MGCRLNFNDAAKVIAHRERRTYSHNALLDLIKRGRLTDCVVWDSNGKAVAIKGEEELMTEFRAKVQTRRRQSPASVLDRSPEKVPRAGSAGDDLPDYNESRARTEFERANLLELERRQKEGLLLPVEQVERVWANAITQAKTKLLGMPSKLRQRIPHLTLEEIAIAEELIRESLEDLAQTDDD